MQKHGAGFWLVKLLVSIIIFFKKRSLKVQPLSMPLVLSLNLSCLQEPCQGLLISLTFVILRQSIGLTLGAAACGGQASVAWLKLADMLQSCMESRQNRGSYFYSFSTWSFWWFSRQQKGKTSDGSAKLLSFFPAVNGDHSWKPSQLHLAWKSHDRLQD